MTDAAESGRGRVFSIQETADLLEISPAEVRRFARAALTLPERPDPDHRFDFRDLVVLRMAAGLRRASISPRRVQRALSHLRSTHGDRLASVRLEAVGGRVVVRDGDAIWSPESGQLQLDLERASGRDRVASAGRTDSGITEPASRPPPGLANVGDDVDAWMDEAARLEASDPVAAASAYRRALSIDPDCAEAHAGLGLLEQEAGRAEAAVVRYRAALELKPDATVAFNLGVALDDLGLGAEAVAAYEQALTLDERMADAHFNLSDLFERAGDRAAAIRHMMAYREITRGN